MADIVYGITIKNKLFEGIEEHIGNSFLKTISIEGQDTNIIVPFGHKLYKTAEERNISIFRSKRNHLSMDKVAFRYNITIEEAQIAYDKAIEMFPEKFI